MAMAMAFLTDQRYLINLSPHFPLFKWNWMSYSSQMWMLLLHEE